MRTTRHNTAMLMWMMETFSANAIIILFLWCPHALITFYEAANTLRKNFVAKHKRMKARRKCAMRVRLSHHCKWHFVLGLSRPPLSLSFVRENVEFAMHKYAHYIDTLIYGCARTCSRTQTYSQRTVIAPSRQSALIKVAAGVTRRDG